MWLLNCPKCNHMISPSAAVCPNCGHDHEKDRKLKSDTT
ncbi:MAG: zinc ribbon domain-containing protein, partial [Bacteroidota bacterium]